MPALDPPALSDSTRVLDLQALLPRPDRPAEAADDLCFTPALVAAFVNAYTQPHERVFDPFAGYGTTLVTAEALGREPLGFEIDGSRVEYSRSRLADPAVVREQDTRYFNWSELPKFRLSITSPPYMTKEDHAQNPLSGYQTLDGDYSQYLRDLQQIYGGIGSRAADSDARIVVNVANLRSTPLAWDVGAALSEVLTFDHEIVLNWDNPQEWFTQDYCLVYRPRP